MNRKVSDTDRIRRHKIRRIINGVRAITIADRRLSQRLAKTHQITARQLGAIRIVSQAPGISLTDLTERMYLHISTGSGIIDRLEKKRLVQRQRDPEDRRRVRLFVTPKGSRIVKGIPLAGFGFLMRDIEALSTRDVRDIWTGINKLLRLLRLENEVTRADRTE